MRQYDAPAVEFSAPPGSRARRLGAILLLTCTWVLCGLIPAEAAPVRVRLAEGNARGFLVLRSLEGEAIAQGEFQQKPVGATIESRLILRFKDGSLREGLAVFSQEGVFRLERYRLVQRGPSFPTMEVSFDRKTGRYEAVTQEKKDDEEKRAGGTLEMPADLYNGLALILLKNMGTQGEAVVQTAVFTPKPRLVKTVLRREDEESVTIAGEAKQAIGYVVKFELGGLTGVVASLIGKKPPALRYWFVAGDIPAFARFEGAMFLNGPVWRLETTLPRWPR
jgi:hypothetical protein